MPTFCSATAHAIGLIPIGTGIFCSTPKSSVVHSNSKRRRLADILPPVSSSNQVLQVKQRPAAACPPQQTRRQNLLVKYQLTVAVKVGAWPNVALYKLRAPERNFIQEQLSSITNSSLIPSMSLVSSLESEFSCYVGRHILSVISSSHNCFKVFNL